MEQSNYRVEFEDFTRRHFVKTFEKKYKQKWDKTKLDIISVCERIDNMLQYKRADLISVNGQYKLVKLDFAIEGTHLSPKKSGNRCILLVDEELKLVRILLVYSKNEISTPNETQKWQNLVKNQYDDVDQIFGL